ncbi:ABC transporter permease subunit [Streptomyces sp. SID4919]|uniref:ABC transporter permease n=1 Tax=Streptomyces TaxID=1883 RepID=UPI0008239B9F|nr:MULTISPECIES: ABC transporter permease [unclassified Streptomyces]MYY10511.1 ABC transporter permease subunit [Streptomyces sp. SID4919]SCK47042.1 peptide/nickel transport system permease protein [Streptomyces sp. AmelKG-E11A]
MLTPRRLAGRLLTALGTLAFVLVLNFVIFRAMGDPKHDLARNPSLTEAAQEALIRQRGLDQSTWVQFVRYLKDTLGGDLGTSFITNRPVTEELLTALPGTLLVVGVATVLASLLGPWIGLLAAWKRGRARDTLLTQGSVVLYSMPSFWLGMVLIAVFAQWWQLLPTGLASTPGSTATGLAHAADVARHAVLPVATLTLGLLAQYAVNMRTAVVDTLREDYVLTARAIGLTPRAVRRRHVVRNAMLPVVTVIGLNLGFVLGGAITVEALFSWPGIGQLTMEAIHGKDYPMLQGLFLLSSVLVIAMNLAIDLLYGRLDPRIGD